MTIRLVSTRYRRSSVPSIWLWALLYLARRVDAVQSLIIKGRHFFYPNGTQFFIRGVAYSDGGFMVPNSYIVRDLLADDVLCARDIPHLVSLSINVMYIDGTNPNLEHSKCMQQLASAGIYVIVLLSGLDLASYQRDGRLVVTLDYTRLESMKQIIDTYAIYNNTLGFWVASRTYWDKMNGLWEQKLLLKEMKKHIRDKKYRQIPVGFELTETLDDLQDDIASERVPAYFNCPEPNDSMDFYMLEIPPRNIDFADPDLGCPSAANLSSIDVFRHVPKSSLPVIPRVFCDQTGLRDFSGIDLVYGENGSSTFAGMIVAHWFSFRHNDTKSGLISVDPKGNLSLKPNYFALSSQLATIHPSSTSMSSYSAVETAQASCTPFEVSRVVTEFGTTSTGLATLSPYVPPPSSAKLCSCMMESLSCVSNLDPHNSTILQNHCPKGQVPLHPVCLGLGMNAAVGKFGTYWSCTNMQRTSWVLNQLYVANNDQESCHESGGAIQIPKPANQMSAECRVYLQQAGPQGTGRVMEMSDDQLSSGLPTSDPVGLSSTTKIGIGLGATVFVISLIAIMIGARFMIFRRRLEKSKDSMTNMVAPKTELPADEMLDSPVPVELCGLEMHEMEGDSPQELASPGILHEADGNPLVYELSSVETTSLSPSRLVGSNETTAER